MSIHNIHFHDEIRQVTLKMQQIFVVFSHREEFRRVLKTAFESATLNEP